MYLDEVLLCPLVVHACARRIAHEVAKHVQWLARGDVGDAHVLRAERYEIADRRVVVPLHVCAQELSAWILCIRKKTSSGLHQTTPGLFLEITNLAKSRWHRNPLTARGRLSAAQRPALPGHRRFRTIRIYLVMEDAVTQ